MKYYLYPTYGLLVASLGLIEILISMKLDEKNLPKADPFWLSIRALFLAFSTGTIPLVILYGIIARRMILHFVLLIATSCIIFSSFIILKKPYLTYPTIILILISIGLAPFIGFLGFIIATVIWVIVALVIYLSKLELPVLDDLIVKYSAKALDWKICILVLVADILVGFLRLHGIPFI